MDPADSPDSMLVHGKKMMNNRNRKLRAGVSLIWVTCFFIMMIAFASFAVDYGRVQLAKTELLRGADAAARAACGSLSSGVSAAQTAASQTAAMNKADGTAISVTTNDI